jgi:hypothetical protein
MSDALTAIGRKRGSSAVIASHGRRKFAELVDDFPAESAVVVDALKLVYDHDK